MNQTVKPELKSPEMKARFFAQYWGQEIQTYKLTYSWRKNVKVDGYASGFITLTPLDRISDEDAIAVAKILDFHDGEGLIIQRNKDHIGVYDKYNDEPFHLNTLYLFHNVLEVFSKDERRKVFQYDLERLLMVTDFLRSRGYALPWNGYSVQELIEANYMKLREGGADNE